MQKKKQKKRKRIKADEEFSWGPLRVARFGKHVLWESRWPSGEFPAFRQRAAADFQKILEHIDSLISNVANIVSGLEPQRILLRAWWEKAQTAMMIESESELATDDMVAFRMIDFVQSIIVSIPPQQEQQFEATEEEWNSLRDSIANIFAAINMDYQISRSAKAAIEDPTYDSTFDEFKYWAQIYWCNVGGQRYPFHHDSYLRDLFLPHSQVLQELFEISADTFVSELGKVLHAHTFGLGEAFDAMSEFHDDALRAAGSKLEQLPDDSDMDISDIMKGVITEKGWEGRGAVLGGRLFGFDLFDLQKRTSLPTPLLDALSWGPGEDTEFFAPGDYKGWPLRVWPAFKRPFIRLDGRYYCFDVSLLHDHIYRVMQRIILGLRPTYKEEWNRIQKATSEELPFKYLGRILPGGQTFRSVFYQGQTDSGRIDWCEADGLLIYDRHLFVIEVKAGAFTYTSPATDFDGYIESVKNLILTPTSQGKRFLKYLLSADEVQIFNKQHSKIGTLRKSQFRCITICPITLDPLTELAAQAQHLRKIGIDVGASPVWSISIDDLRVFADIFDDPLVFLHFVEQRMRAFDSELLKTDDELDHVGLYVKHNNYAMYAAGLDERQNSGRRFVGYRADIDKFFHARMLDGSTPSPLKQATPWRVLEIVKFLSATALPGRSDVTSYLLDIGSDWRQILADSIDTDITRQLASLSPRPFSTHGNVKLTVCCWTDTVVRDGAFALEHAKTVMLLSNEERRLLLELCFDSQRTLRDVFWRWIELKAIPPSELMALRQRAEGLRRARVQNAIRDRGKLQRNEPCPCGSSKKYKKCCL